MATRFWVGGTGNWDAATTTNWAATSGGAGGASVPTSSDTVTFDGSSGGGTVTVTANTATVQSITMGAFTGTFDANGFAVSTSGTFNISGTATRTITLGSSTITCQAWTATTTTNLTFNANTSSITHSGAGTFAGGGLTYSTVLITSNSSPTISGTNTFTTLTRTIGATTTARLRLSANQIITGTFTATGDNGVNRLLIESNVLGTQRTITAGTVSTQYTDWKDINGQGAASWNLSGVTWGSGDCGGNSNITFSTPKTAYYRHSGGAGTSISWRQSVWWTGSGGSGTQLSSISQVVLPQDTAIINSGSFTAASQTLEIDSPRPAKDINFTGVTNTPTITTSTAASIFGSLTLVSGLTLTASTQAYTFEGRGTHTITMAGKTWAKLITFEGPGGTYTLQDNLVTTGTSITFTRMSTFNANNYNLTAPLFDLNNNAAGMTINMGSGVWEATGTTGNVWTGASTSLTLNRNTSTVKITNTGSGAVTFNGMGLTYNNVWFSRGASTGSITISGSNTFTDFKDDGSAAHSILFTTGTTQTVTTFTVSGTSGNVITINSTTTGTHALVKSGGGTISLDYLNIQHSVATPASTWYAGTHSTNNQAVATAGSGWIFTDPPAPSTRRVFMIS